MLTIFVVAALMLGVVQIMPVTSAYADDLPYLSIDAGSNHSFAIRNDGTLWSWGHNYYGQLGDGTTINRNTPVQISNLTGITTIAAGDAHSLAVKNDGMVWSWGSNTNGQLGDGTTINRNTPVQVSNLTGITTIAPGGMHSLAVKNNGTVWSWGYNYYGQLGDGTQTNRTAPVQVPNLTDITAIATGFHHSLAVNNDGTVWAWGCNINGRLGDGTQTNRTAPVQVSNLTDITTIATGSDYSLAVRNDGTVWAWGCNTNGQLGDGTTTDRNTPVQVSNLTGIVAVTAGYNHSLAVRNDGTVWAWGCNANGQFGVGTSTTTQKTPVQVSNLTGIVAVTAGYAHSLAVRNDGTVWACGCNYHGQLGDGTTISKSTPVQANLPIAIQAPKNLEAEVLGKQVTIKFSPSSNATGYKINRSTDNSSFILVTDITSPAIEDGKVKYVDAAPNYNTTYYYKVEAYSSNSTGAYSTITVATDKIPTPSKVTVKVSGKDAVIKFKSVSGVDGYSVERRLTKNVEFTEAVAVNDNTTDSSGYISITDNTTDRLAEYEYQVRAKVGTNKSEPSTPLIKITTGYGKPDKPTGVKAEWVNEGVKISWTAGDDILTYQVQRKETTSFSNLAKVETNEYIDKTTKQLTYQVIALYKTIKSDASDEVIPTGAAPLSAPANVQATAINNKVNLTWDAVTGASGYIVEKMGESDYEQAATVEVCSVVIENLQPLTEYKFRIKAAGHALNKYSLVKSIKTSATPPSAVSNLTATVTGNEVTLAWEAVNDVRCYTVERYVGDTFQKKFTAIKNSSTDKGLTYQAEYKYKVYAVGKSTSEPTEVTVKIGAQLKSAPANLKVSEVTDTKVTLVWDAVEEAESYTVFKSTDGKTFEEADTVETPGYTNNDLTASTKYYYKVKADNSEQSKVIYTTTTATPPSAASNLTATVTGNEVTLSWDTVDGARCYTVERYVGDTFQKKFTATKNSYTDKGLTYQVEYKYKVYAVSKSTSEPTVVTVTIGAQLKSAPTNFKVIEVTDTKVTLAWDAVDGAESYTVFRSTDGKTFEEADTVETPGYTDNDLTASTKYYYKVKADSSEQSKAIYTITSATPPSAVSNLKATVIGNEVTLSWDTVDGARCYTVERYVDEVFQKKFTAIKNSYTNKSLEYGKEYTYKVYAVGKSTSEPTGVTVTTGSEKPTLTITTANGKVVLTPACSTQGVTFKIQKATSSAGDYDVISENSSEPYTDADVEVSKTYYYKITAVDSAGNESAPYKKSVKVK